MYSDEKRHPPHLQDKFKEGENLRLKKYKGGAPILKVEQSQQPYHYLVKLCVM